MSFKGFIVLLLASLNLHCSLSDKPQQKNGKTDTAKTSAVKTYGDQNTTLSPHTNKNIIFDLPTFRGEVQQKISQINMSEEEKDALFNVLNTKALAFMKIIEQQLKELFSDLSLNTEQKIHKSTQIINSIEPEIRKLVSTSFLSQHLDPETLDKIAYPSVLEEQRRAQNTVRRLMRNELEKRLDTLLNQIETLQKQITRYSDQVVQRSLSTTGPHTPQALFEKEISNPVKETLRDSYNRAELSLLKDPELIKNPVGKVYQFQSIEQSLSSDTQTSSQPHKFVRIYDRLWHSYPFHEQGILAKKCGLKALEQADQAIMHSMIQEADILYISALALEEIVLFGILPNDTRRSIYELCTGRNLLTGRILANEEILVLPIDESYFNKQNKGTFFTKSDITNALKEISVIPNITTVEPSTNNENK